MIESEKTIERKLKKYVENLGGLCIKLVCLHFTGLPDRMILLPGGICKFAEVKTTKKKPSPRQEYVARQLRKLGFEVWIIDSTIELRKMMKC